MRDVLFRVSFKAAQALAAFHFPEAGRAPPEVGMVALIDG
jgi:hypothetical protein